MSRLPIAILISGRGSNMRVIVERAAAGTLPVDVRVVVSDKPSAEGLSLAADMNIATRVLEPRDFPDRPAYDRALVELLRQFQPQLVLLAGFMRILTPQFIGAFAAACSTCIPRCCRSIPPATRTDGPEAGDAAHGASIHFVTEQLDGGPVVLQAEVPVVPGDTKSRFQREFSRPNTRSTRRRSTGSRADACCCRTAARGSTASRWTRRCGNPRQRSAVSLRERCGDRMRTIVSLLLSSLAMLLLGSTVHAEAAVPRPFSATYAVSFRGIGAGTITFDFARDAATGRYIYETHASPSTLARLFVSKAAMERSVMEIDDSGTRPIDWKLDDAPPATRRTASCISTGRAVA
jgi:phosphoribosylglycinamide formyltransferase-1